MTETNAIVKAQNGSVIRSMDDAERAAKAMVASGFFQDTKQMSQAVVKILAGQELGFGPFASMTGVSIIQNKPTIGANLMAAAVKRTGKYNYRVTSVTDELCEIEFYEDGKPVGKSKFTMADADKAGLRTKDNWRKYPRNMLFARALSNGQKWYAPDVFGGATVYTPDELGAAVDEEGNAVGPDWNVQVVEAAEETPAEVAAITYDEAMNVQIKTSNGMKQLGELNKTQLDAVIAKSKDAHAIDAAKVVLMHDFSMEPAAADAEA